jgi:hypothetical protein
MHASTQHSSPRTALTHLHSDVRPRARTQYTIISTRTRLLTRGSAFMRPARPPWPALPARPRLLLPLPLHSLFASARRARLRACCAASLSSAARLLPSLFLSFARGFDARSQPPAHEACVVAKLARAQSVDRESSQTVCRVLTRHTPHPAFFARWHFFPSFRPLSQLFLAVSLLCFPVSQSHFLSLSDLPRHVRASLCFLCLRLLMCGCGCVLILSSSLFVFHLHADHSAHVDAPLEVSSMPFSICAQRHYTLVPASICFVSRIPLAPRLRPRLRQPAEAASPPPDLLVLCYCLQLDVYACV